MEEDDNSVIEVPQESKEPDVIIINDENDEEVPAAQAGPNRTPVNGSGDHEYSLPFSTWGKAEDHKPGEPMLGHVYLHPDEQDAKEYINLSTGI